MLTQIARCIYAINFNKQETKDRVILLNQNNQDIEYIVFKQQNKLFTIIQMQNIDNIKNKYDLNDDEIINAIFQTDKNTIIQNKYFYIDYKESITAKQLYNYFVEKLKMQQLQFNKYFNIEYNNSIFYKVNEINFKIERNCIDKKLVINIIKELKNIKYPKIFYGLLINFTDEITQRDSNNIGGNTVHNKYGYKTIINVQVKNGSIFRTLLHELGHCYQKLYLTKDEIDNIYNYVLQNSDKIYCTRDDYFLKQSQTIAQFFAEYYYQTLNQESNFFVQEKILK